MCYLNSGANLNLDDQALRENQLERRRSGPEVQSSHPRQAIKVGDTVTVVGSQNKHTVRDVFVVTGTRDGRVQAQKLLHPLDPGKVKLMSKVYDTDPKRLITSGRYSRPLSSGSPPPSQPEMRRPTVIRPPPLQDSDSESEEDEPRREIPQQAA